MSARTTRWSFLKENSKPISRILGANLATNLLPGAFGILLYFVVSKVAEGPSGLDALRWLCGAYVALFLVYIATSMWSQKVSYMNAYGVSTALRLRLGDKLRRLPMSFLKRHDPGDITSRLLGDVQKAENSVARVLPDLVSVGVTPAVLGAFLFHVNADLAFIAVGVAVLAGGFLVLARRVVKSLGKRHVEAVTRASARFVEYFRVIKLLKSHNLAGDRFATMDEAMRLLKTSCFRTEVWTAIPVQLYLFTLDVGYLVLILGAVTALAAGETTWRDMASFAVVGFFFFEAVKTIGPMLVELGYISVSTRRIGEVFEAPELPFSSKARAPSSNEIVFERVGFGYRGSPVLKGVDCRIPEKSLTALVGLSGSGKSTMMNLMLRFWDADTGRVTLGGVPLTEIDPDDLLARFATVFQDVFLFNDTVAENIRIGRRDATREEIVEAAREARCHDFITALPNGYDTMVGERGSALSGGERQRVSIARAILKDAPIILLDEATASLDPENEAEIQKAFESLIREKTVVVIAHRFAPIEHARQILVLDGGNVVERGRHADLVNSGGLYRRLWEKQRIARGWKMA